MIKKVAFERCTDFLARMIEKYGSEVIFPTDESKEIIKEKDNDGCDSKSDQCGA